MQRDCCQEAVEEEGDRRQETVVQNGRSQERENERDEEDWDHPIA